MFQLPEEYAAEMVAHARDEDPLECCGLLAGKDGKITKLYRATNADASPLTYTVDPKDTLTILKEIDDNDSDLLAIYHSHTHTGAYPSATDVRKAYWQEPLYIIVSLEDKARPVLRAFYIRNGQIQEESIVESR